MEKIKFSDFVVIFTLFIATLGILYLLSQTQWRDKFGKIHPSYVISSTYQRDGQPYWYDELTQGSMPGRHDYE
jgi:hypothetical protein